MTLLITLKRVIISVSYSNVGPMDSMALILNWFTMAIVIKISTLHKALILEMVCRETKEYRIIRTIIVTNDAPSPRKPKN